MKGRRNMRTYFKKTFALLLLTATLITTVGGIAAYADFGSGVATMAEGTEIIKTAISGKKIIFSDADIKQGLCISDFKSIKIVSVPPSEEGTLMLAGRKVNAGTSIKRKNIGALVFVPASGEVKETSFKFTLEEFTGGEVNFVIKFTEKVNYAPSALSLPDDGKLYTQREISVFGKMEGEDREGDTLEYMVIKYPEEGSLKVLNSLSGEFCYTPHNDYVGEDSFTFVARDEWGNYSKPCEIKIAVSERMSEIVYTDMTSHPDYNAAVALSAMGIMDGRLLGDGVYFMPDSTVSKAEFVAMAMKSAGVQKIADCTETFFDDDELIPEPLKGYVATAQELGIIYGTFKDGKLLFNPSDSITCYDAAVIMANIIDADLSVSLPSFTDTSTIPVWARSSVAAMCQIGIFDGESESIKADRALTKAECAAYLYKLSSAK